MSGVTYLLLHSFSWHDKEQIYVYFYDGGSSVKPVGNILINVTTFRYLIMDCMSGHIEEVKILGEELKQMYSAVFRKLKWATSEEVCRSCLYLYLLIYSNVIQHAIVSPYLNKSIIY